MSEHSELYNWLNSLPGGLHLERCSKEFESCGFQSLSSLKYLRPGDIEAFFPSPEKRLLAEKRILEKGNEGFPRLGKQANTIETHRTFPEVQHF